MAPAAQPRLRDAVATRARILEAAQFTFAEKGYSQTGVRDVALQAGVASSLVIKYYRTKANLFREALIQVFAGLDYQEGGKLDFASRMVDAIVDPQRRMVAPTMMALSLGDPEAREIVESVVSGHVIKPVAQWLGPPDAEARAASLLMLSTGFALFGRHLKIGLSEAETAALRRIVEDHVAAVVGVPPDRAGSPASP